MELEQAQGLISAVFAAGKARAASPLAAVVVDAGGHVVASAREDGATIARHDFALAKAWSSIALGLDTRELAQRAETNPAFFSAACTLFSGRLLPAPGGIVIRDGDIILGALGVSGTQAKPTMPVPRPQCGTSWHSRRERDAVRKPVCSTNSRPRLPATTFFGDRR